jgi:hypothetical protein
MAWNYNAPVFSPVEQHAKKLVNNVLGNNAGDGIARGLSLYRYLMTHKDTDTETLRKSIGDELFGAQEFQNVMDVIKSQAHTPYAQSLMLTQVGGGQATPRDPEADEFWDQMLRKLVQPLQSLPFLSCISKERIDSIFYFIFILNNLEQIDFIGPMLSTALDTVTLSLPVLADLTQEMAGKVLGMFPVPYAALVGEAVGYAIALIFVLTGMTLNVSRRRFGSAFKTSLAGIPIIGDILMMGAINFEKGAERYLINRQKFIDALKKYSPHGANVIDYWSPTPEIVTRPAVYPNPEILKRNVLRIGTNYLGIDGVDPDAILSDPRGPGAALAELALKKGAAAGSQVANAALGAADAARTKVANAALGATRSANNRFKLKRKSATRKMRLLR